MEALSSYGKGSHWRFDAIDARAGLAFATWRPDRDTGATRSDLAPCLHFAPPFFKAEPMVGNGLAWGATRGSFAPELRVGEHEAWFRTQEDVAEFVRRSYVSGGAGDGGDEGPAPEGEPPPEPPRDGPSPGDVERGERPPLAEALLGHVKQFDAMSGRLDPGQTRSFAWQVETERAGGDAVVQGALFTVTEMLHRRPAQHSTALQRWVSDLGAFLRVASATGLLAGRHAEAFDRLFHRHDIELRDRLLYWIHRPVHVDAAPLRFLRRMPVPAFARSLLPADLGDKASLYHLLSAFIASPQHVLKLPHAGDVVELVMFASAMVVSANKVRRDAQHFEYFFSDWVDIHAHAEDAAREGYLWLKEHLPALAFSSGIESAIADCKTLRYRTRLAGL